MVCNKIEHTNPIPTPSLSLHIYEHQVEKLQQMIENTDLVSNAQGNSNE